MANSPRRVVITGGAAFTPIGTDAAAIWESLRAGRGGVAPIRAFDAARLPCRVAGEIPDFVARTYFSNKDPAEKQMGRSLRLMSRTVQLGLVAAKFAMQDAGLVRGQYDSTRFGVEFGCLMIAVEVDELVPAARAAVASPDAPVNFQEWGARGLDTIEPTWMLKFLPNMPACHVSVLYDLQGPSNSITSGDVASLLALGEALRIIGRGQADAFLVGGCDSRVSQLAYSRNNLFQPLSKRNDEPARACRPFDKDRDGTVLGEGAGVVVLEELEHARKRGAKIRAEVAGFGAAFDARRDGSGLARAIQAALADANIGPEELDHVHAQGYGVPQADHWEAAGIRSALGAAADRVPVFAAKGYIGNLGAAAGIVELFLSLLSLDHGELPSTLNCDSPDPACPVVIHNKGLRTITRPYMLKLGFTDMGQCAAAVLRKWE
ncbi:MAG: beta-ketoacyl-[acyl-carrier-protein] synthase family protein [Gemmataceae bacterium]